jgi:hypothetical protein
MYGQTHGDIKPEHMTPEVGAIDLMNPPVCRGR